MTGTINCIPLIERIFPKASELCEILNYNPCPEYGCSEIFHNTPNLEMHLRKFHGKDDERNQSSKKKNVIRQYYCPEIGCKYMYNPNLHMQDNRFFTQHKYLKQHYIKVHMEKKFICEQCGKGFATAQHLKRHLDECGLKFVCSCSAEYSTIPALLTHASRKKHPFIKSWTAVRGRKTDQNATHNQFLPQSPILPKTMQLGLKYDDTVTSTANALSELSWSSIGKGVDKGIQTEPPSHRRRRTSTKMSDTSRQTQTGDKRPRISSETQTVAEFSFESKSKCKAGRSTGGKWRKKSMETQTCVSKGNLALGNGNINESITYCDLSKSLCSDIILPQVEAERDIVLPQLWLNSSSTQTVSHTKQLDIFSLENSSSDAQIFSDMQTFIDKSSKGNLQNLLNSVISNSDYQFNASDDSTSLRENYFGNNKLSSILHEEGKSCSTETQTEVNSDTVFESCQDMFMNIETQTTQELLDHYNNICTQTCDDFILSDLGFSDIETQTVWPDFNIDNSLVSTETQTIPHL